jgi:hypothetical protein
MARVNWWGFLTETAGLTLGLEQAQDVVNLDCRWVSGVVRDLVVGCWWDAGVQNFHIQNSAIS